MKFRPAPRRLLAAAAAVLFTAGVTGCSAGASEGEQTTIRYQTNAGIVLCSVGCLGSAAVSKT